MRGTWRKNLSIAMLLVGWSTLAPRAEAATPCGCRPRPTAESLPLVERGSLVPNVDDLPPLLGPGFERIE